MTDAWLGLLLLYALGRGRGRQQPAAAAAAAPRPPAGRARIYKLPIDSYETVHLAVQLPGGPWKEVGVFSSAARAVELAVKPKGYQLQPGVQTFASREDALR